MRDFRARTYQPKRPPQPIDNENGTFSVQLGGHRRGESPAAWAIIDASDIELAARYRWSIVDGYATRGAGARGKHRMIRLHREILGLKHGDGIEVDHVNRDRLDCRRRNLRILDHSANCQNVPEQYRGLNATGYRGVRRTPGGSFQAYATVKGRFHHLGVFDVPEEAAKVAREFRLAAMPGAVD